MNNVQLSFQMVECDDQTAELHIAMAEMMQDDEGDIDAHQVPAIQPDVMQFTVAQDQAYAKQDKMYNFQINDFTYYLTSYYNNVSCKEIKNVASNIMEVVGTTPTLDQKVKLAI